MFQVLWSCHRDEFRKGRIGAWKSIDQAYREDGKRFLFIQGKKSCSFIRKESRDWTTTDQFDGSRSSALRHQRRAGAIPSSSQISKTQSPGSNLLWTQADAGLFGKAGAGTNGRQHSSRSRIRQLERRAIRHALTLGRHDILSLLCLIFPTSLK